MSQNNNIHLGTRRRVGCRIPREVLDLLNAIANAYASPFRTTKSLIDHIVETALRERPWRTNPWPDLRPRRAADYSGTSTGYVDYAVRLPEEVIHEIYQSIGHGAASSPPSFMLLSILWWIGYRHADAQTRALLLDIQRKCELPYPFGIAVETINETRDHDPVPVVTKVRSKSQAAPKLMCSLQEVQLVGLDAAADLKKFGCAIGRIAPGVHRRIDVAESGLLKSDDGLRMIAAKIRESSRCLIAIDAPLGWPIAMGNALANHVAGCPFPGLANNFFRRLTDRKIKERTGKLPLDVGADRIARAAFQALSVLDRLSAETELPVRLVWSPNEVEPGFLSVIEVYPAATLKSRGLPDTAYKKPKQQRERMAIADGLAREAIIDVHRLVHAPSDVFDAALCLVAATDFLEGNVQAPTEDEMDTAMREGWIWAR